MCYDLKTYRCGHFERTFTNCKCTLHCSGEQRQPKNCNQWFCNKKPYYSDGACDRDHITNIGIGHYFNPETGRRGRYRPGQHLRSLRAPRSNSTASTHSSFFALPSTRLPSGLLEHLAIHPDELILDRDPSDPDGLEEETIEERVFGIRIPSHTNADEYFASVPRVLGGHSQGQSQGLSPSDILGMIAREIRAQDGDIQPFANAMGGILRAAEVEARQHRPPPATLSAIPHHRSPAPATISAAYRRGTSGRPVRINPPNVLRNFRPARAVVESGSGPGPRPGSGSGVTPPVSDLMDIEEDLHAMREAIARVERRFARENSQQVGPQANPEAGPSGSNNTPGSA
ncbi:hypothetical protein TWF106_004621 [Orbilia oligospora]|uniref:Uncharacterized protein n=1 Tax=Orbilia oligospora TaxID=2813651 RepID=A0A7C8QR02_ORBOL|nr:hypothetical protein TWF106_004621 [Orbilia oligospora]